MICDHCFFFHGFKFQHSVCNGCLYLTVLSVIISGIAHLLISGIAHIVGKDVGYCCVIVVLANLKQLLYQHNGVL